MDNIEIISLSLGRMDNNCYIVYVEGGSECVIIDAPYGYDTIKKTLTEKQLTPVAVLITHGHFDHTGSVAALQREGAKVYIHEADAPMLTSISKSYAYAVRKSFEATECDVALQGGETLELAGMAIEVLHTPGHSKGSVTYKIRHVLFCGDTVFKGSYGRYDLYGGNLKELYRSITGTLFPLEGDYAMLCGHGDSTTLEYERKHNEILIDCHG